MKKEKKDGVLKSILKARAKREEDCLTEIQNILEKHSCFIEVQMILTQEGNKAQIKVTSK